MLACSEDTVTVDKVFVVEECPVRTGDFDGVVVCVGIEVWVRLVADAVSTDTGELTVFIAEVKPVF
jgi:hypothetical protein